MSGERQREKAIRSGAGSASSGSAAAAAAGRAIGGTESITACPHSCFFFYDFFVVDQSHCRSGYFLMHCHICYSKGLGVSPTIVDDGGVHSEWKDDELIDEKVPKHRSCRY